ncbi:Pol polyprotein [Elysia marginata]|uniref:Pol polyprotein n=1 Tax=Elysia marginata TaxID=1093978 RepID=A0AAV4IPM2_9GAST|nr:Pol polyprotein [Elysia marginata]
MTYVQEGWPVFKQDIKLAARKFFAIRGELSCWHGILLKGDRIVVPLELREEVLDKIHAGHLGMTMCKESARQAVWWPRIGADICNKISACHTCIEKWSSQRSEPIIPSEIPERPYEKVGSDLFEINRNYFIVIIDYYSKNIDVEKLPNQSTNAVIKALKKCFFSHGVPLTLVTDNAQCYKSHEFSNFATDWNFCHVTSSPRFSQSNGQAESAVNIAKRIMKQPDPSLALMAYRSTPVASTGVTPAELALGRKIRTTLSMLPHKLEPKTCDKTDIKHHNHDHQQAVKKNFDRYHSVRPLPELLPCDSVVVKLNENSDWPVPGRINNRLQEKRSYLVDTPKGILRRNRKHLKTAPTLPWQPETPQHHCLVSTPSPSTPKAPDVTTATATRAPVPPVKHPAPTRQPNNNSTTDGYRTISGRLVKQPARFIE